MNDHIRPKPFKSTLGFVDISEVKFYKLHLTVKGPQNRFHLSHCGDDDMR